MKHDMLLSMLLICLLNPCNSSVIFSSVLLMDASGFSAKTFSSLVLKITNATSLTLHSVEPDTITGVQGKRLFANPSGFYSFQLLHITRVLSSVETYDEKTVSAIIRHSLPHEALLRGMGVMGIESMSFGLADANQWLTTTYLELPSFVAQYLILGWVFTIIAFFSCVVCYCCCCVGRTIPAAIALTTITTVPAVVKVTQLPIPAQMIQRVPPPPKPRPIKSTPVVLTPTPPGNTHPTLISGPTQAAPAVATPPPMVPLAQVNRDVIFRNLKQDQVAQLLRHARQNSTHRLNIPPDKKP